MEAVVLFKNRVRRRFGINHHVSEYGVIGHGRVLKVNPLTPDEVDELVQCGIRSEGGITTAFAELLLDNDFKRAEKTAIKQIGKNPYEMLSEERKSALLDVIWQAKFKVKPLKPFFKAMKQFDFDLAAVELLARPESMWSNYVRDNADLIRFSK